MYGRRLSWLFRNHTKSNAMKGHLIGILGWGYWVCNDSTWRLLATDKTADKSHNSIAIIMRLGVHLSYLAKKKVGYYRLNTLLLYT